MMAFDPVIRAWLIPWQDGQLGIAYTTRTRVERSRLVRGDDPELPALRAMLPEVGRQRLDERINNVVPFPNWKARPKNDNVKARR